MALRAASAHLTFLAFIPCLVWSQLSVNDAFAAAYSKRSQCITAFLEMLLKESSCTCLK